MNDPQTADVSYKSMTFGYYITGQEDQAQTVPTIDAIKKAHEHYQKVHLGEEDAWVEDLGEGRKIKLYPLTYDSERNAYFGGVARYRAGTLPYIENLETKQERKIPLGTAEEVLERSYFSYFPDEDILVFQENLLGARVDDFAYFLRKNGGGPVSFEPIWRTAAVKSLLENKSFVRKVELSIALPRRFELGGFNLQQSWNRDVLAMMANTGMSKLNLTLFGRARARIGESHYLTTEIKHAIKEMLEVFSSGKSTPTLKKAKITTTDEEPLNLLDERLRSRVRLGATRGYVNEFDVFEKMLYSKANLSDELGRYRANAA